VLIFRVLSGTIIPKEEEMSNNPKKWILATVVTILVGVVSGFVSTVFVPTPAAVAVGLGFAAVSAVLFGLNGYFD